LNLVNDIEYIIIYSGGHLGLWIGMSVISFIEVFELIITLIKWCARGGRSNKTSSLTDLDEKSRRADECPTPVLKFKESWVNDD